MGDLIGGIIGGVGSIIGGNKAAKAQKEAAKQALTGYNYLSNNEANQSAQGAVAGAQESQGAALGQQGGTTSNIAQLLGTEPITDQTKNGFTNYLNSTGHQFQLQQGQEAITGSAAARGVLNSGATAKALTKFGQNLGTQSFNNYLGQLGGLAGQQGNLASAYGGIVNTGVNAAGQVGQAGNIGGGNAATQTAGAGESKGTGIAGAFNAVGGGLQSGINTGQFKNFFGGI